MLERRIGHLPVVEDGRLVGMITQTDLTRFQAVSSASSSATRPRPTRVAELAAVTARIPQLLVQLVGGDTAHEVVDPPDHRHRRHRDPPPAGDGRGGAWPAAGALPVARLRQPGAAGTDRRSATRTTACSSTTRATDADMAYFDRLARFVSRRAERLRLCLLPRRHDGHEPAMVPADAGLARLLPPLGRPRPTRWRRCWPRVMFDLRPIGGATALFHDLQDETLDDGGEELDLRRAHDLQLA